MTGLSFREIATVLHALRGLQWVRNGKHFAEYAPLSNEEIDTLCERINLSDAEEIVR